MNAKVFVIARFKDGNAYILLRDELEKLGITLTHDWYTEKKLKLENRRRTMMQYGRQILYDKDLRGIRDAEYVIVWWPIGDDGYTEFGAALMAEKPVIMFSAYGEKTGEGYHEHSLVIAKPCMEIWNLGNIPRVAETIRDIIQNHKEGV